MSFIPSNPLCTGGIPTGYYAHDPNNLRPTSAFYYGIQNCGDLLIYATDTATRLRARQDCVDAHFRVRFQENMHWSVPPFGGAMNIDLDALRISHLRPNNLPVAYGLREDLRVWNHYLKNVCGGTDNELMFGDCRDLYYFLRHCATRAQPTLQYIKRIIIMNPTQGTCVHDALCMLRRCTGLRVLDIRLCPDCGDFNGPTNGKKAWEAFRHNLGGAGGRLIIGPNPAAAPCSVCHERQQHPQSTRRLRSQDKADAWAQDVADKWGDLILS